MRILVFGGSFDPVHRGHVALLKAADRAVRPDRILLLPTGVPPHKPAPAAPFAARAAMLRAALKSEGSLARRTRIDPFEAAGRGPHYTYRTLRHLAARHPGAEFFLLLGSDQLAAFGAWRRPDEVRRRARLVAGLRRGSRRPRAAGVRWLAGGFPAAASSQIRLRLAGGRSAAGLVPPGALRLIVRGGWYGTGWIRRLKRMLGPARFRHTLAVSRLAGELADRHGLDAWKAQQAALLHDCGRSLKGVEELEHAAAGARLARERFGVKDREVLAAIADHTLGRPGMGRLSRLLYAADGSSEDRKFPAAAGIRAAARRDLEEGFLLAARNKLAWVKRAGLRVHPRGEATLRWAERVKA